MENRQSLSADSLGGREHPGAAPQPLLFLELANPFRVEPAQACSSRPTNHAAGIMRRPVQGMLWGVVLLAATVGAAALAGRVWLRPFIEFETSAILGRPITIRSLALSLRSVAPLIIDFDNRDVVVGNPLAFPPGAEPLARIALVRVSLDVLATLRRGQFMTSSVDLQHPVIVAAATPNGEKNYVFPSRHVQAEALRITDGHAHVTLAGLHADLEVEFSTQAASDADRQAQIVATAEGTYAALPTTARLTWDAALRSGSDAQPSRFTLQVTDGQTRIAGRGTLLDPITPSRANATMTMSGPDMALLKPMIGVTLPSTPPYTVDVGLVYADGLYRVTGNAGRVGQSDLEGAITIRAGGRQPLDVTADLASRAATIADLVAVIADQRDGGILAMSGSRLFSPAPLRLPQLDGGALHLTYRARSLHGTSTSLNDLSLHVELAAGALTLRPLSVGVGRGKLMGNLLLAPQPGGAMRAEADVRLDGVGLAHLVGPTKYQEAGPLNGTMHLRGTGASVAAILGAADGEASLWMQKGDVSALFVDLAGLRLGSALLAWLSGPRVTRVQCFAADLPMRHGVVTTRALILETTDSVMQRFGTANLAQERVELRLRTQSKHFTVGLLPGPLLISGPLADPRTEPDPSAATSHGLARVLSMLPRVQLGTDDAPRCEAVLDRLREGRAAR
jgi:AsmA family protein